MFLNTKIAALAASAVMLASGAFGATIFDKSVSLTVDGHTQTVHGFGNTVGDVLRNNGVTLGERDLVFPTVSDPIEDGGAVSVVYSRKVTATVDGVAEEFDTTARTLDAALAEWSAHDLRDARVSVSRSNEITREGISVTITTPKKMVLVVAGKKKTLTTTAATVAELLGERGLSVDSDDKISPELNLPITEGMRVRLTRVSLSVTKKTETVPFSVVRKKTADLYVGESKVVTQGRNGSAKVTYEVTRTNGKVSKKVAIKRTITTKPVTQVLLVGTKTAPSGAGINLARAAMWDRIAQCESGGNWSINTGNGYYGGLQFALASWRANGGNDFAVYPHHASRAEQITVANRYYAKAGLSPWGCRHAA